MKIRCGFVTNSSSSTYVILGKTISTDNLDKNDEKLMISICEKLYDQKLINENPEDKNISELYEIEEEEIKEYFREESEFAVYDDGYSQITIGRDMGDILSSKEYADVKVKDLYAKVASDLNDKYGTNYTEKEIGYTAESEYDG